METSPVKAYHMEQRSVIRFSLGKRTGANAIQSTMHPEYGDKCFTRPTIHVRSLLNADDEDEERPGQQPAAAGIVFASGIQNLLTDVINAQMNMEDMLQNKRYCLRFKRFSC